MPADPSVVSISSSNTMNPDEIPRRSFPAVRKGVDGGAVRRYLESVADDLRVLLEREAQLRRQLAEAERRAAEPPVLDEATLSRAVGDETARVLQSAHDAAREVVARAEARAAELLAEAEAQAAARSAAAEEESTQLLQTAAEEALATAATAQAEATALREGAEAEAEALMEAARDDAVALLDTTKQRCRQTVRDARQLRTTVLSDLVERRRALFVQLEQLRSGRDSLVEVVEAVEATVEKLKGRLGGAEHDARLAAAEAGDRAELSVDEGVDTLLAPDLALEFQSELLGEELEGASAGAEAVSAAAEAIIDLAAEELIGDEEEERAHEVRAQDTAASHRSVGELFARIRAARSADGAAAGAAATVAPAAEAAATEAEGEAVAPLQTTEPERGGVTAGAELSEVEAAAESSDLEEKAGAEVETAAEVTEREAAEVKPEAPPSAAAGAEAVVAADADAPARARRDALLAPVLGKLSRGLKRALHDDQNELLNALRQASGSPDLEGLLPEGAQRERFALAASAALADGWLVGRSWLRPDVSSKSEEEDAAVAAEAAETGHRLGLELAGELTGLVRHRLSESLRALGEVGEGAQDAAGAAYREWKGPRVEGIAADFATRAFAAGAVAAGEGTVVRWVVDDGKPCPDCDDNALAGELPAGAVWPTGQVHPPVHPGCRCLLVATTD